MDKLFGKKAPSSSPPALPPQIDEMGLHEVVAHLRDVEKPVFADLSQSYRRLLDIALVEHGYEDGEREFALKIAEAVKADIIQTCADRPDAIEAFETASAFQIEQAKYFGYGSLHWITEEEGVDAANLIEFVAQPQFANLLPNYLSMQTAEALGQIRFAVVKAMIAARREHEDQTDLQVLFELIAKPDPSIQILMTEPEIAIIANAPNDFEAAELLSVIYR